MSKRKCKQHRIISRTRKTNLASLTIFFIKKLKWLLLYIEKLFLWKLEKWREKDLLSAASLLKYPQQPRLDQVRARNQCLHPCRDPSTWPTICCPQVHWQEAGWEVCNSCNSNTNALKPPNSDLICYIRLPNLILYFFQALGYAHLERYFVVTFG